MILGVDLGKKTTGIAISEGNLASSLQTITHDSLTEAVAKVVEICNFQSIDKVILGYVEGKDLKYYQKFNQMLKKQLPNIQLVLWDETLTSRQARSTMVKLNIPKTKRAQKEHEVAASLILQSYLDSQ